MGQKHTKKEPLQALAFTGSFKMEEEVGFEPTVRYKRTTVFKTAPINRSGTPP